MDGELDIGACCPRCNSTSRRALKSTMEKGIRRRRVECTQCQKTFFAIEIREECYVALIEAANSGIGGIPDKVISEITGESTLPI